MSDFFAVFVVAKDSQGKVAMTTRPKGKSQAFGLPGGKVDPGEMPYQAVVREALEEGWEVRLEDTSPFHIDIINGKRIGWFSGYVVRQLKDYKEKKRGIKTFVESVSFVAKTGYGNDLAMKRFQEISENSR